MTPNGRILKHVLNSLVKDFFYMEQTIVQTSWLLFFPKNIHYFFYDGANLITNAKLLAQFFSKFRLPPNVSKDLET